MPLNGWALGQATTSGCVNSDATDAQRRAAEATRQAAASAATPAVPARGASMWQFTKSGAEVLEELDSGPNFSRG